MSGLVDRICLMWRPDTSAYIAGFAPIIMFATAIWLVSGDSVLGQSPGLEAGQVAASPGSGGAPSSEQSGRSASPAPSPEDEEPTAVPEVQADASDETPVTEGGLWAKALQDLIAGIEAGERTPEDADALYETLSNVLQVRRLRLRAALETARSPDASIAGIPEPALVAPTPGAAVGEEIAKVGAPELATEDQTVEELHGTMVELYRTRIALLDHVTSKRRGRVIGPGVTGFRELRGEIQSVLLGFRFSAISMRQDIDKWPERLQKNPLSVLMRFVQLIVALMAFRWWRRWAPIGIMRAREKLLEARPRRRGNLRLARFLWYVDRVRHPLEWLAFLAALLFVVLDDSPFFEYLAKAPWSVVLWVLLSWFVVAFLNTVAARGAAGLTGETARLRLGSFTLVATWIVLLGLGLDLAAEHAGRGTIYNWVWFLFEALALPLLVLLTVLWRPHVFQSLDAEPRLPPSIERRLEHRRGLKSWITTSIAGLYLIGLRLQEGFLEIVSQTDWGGRILANLYSRQLESESGQRTDDAQPISRELHDQLIVGEGKIVEKFARQTLLRLVEWVESGHGGEAVIIAERGGGKTTLLQRLASRIDDRALIIDCPYGGYESFREAFAKALGLPGQEASPETFGRRLIDSDIRVVALDNCHRLTRPIKDGLKDFDRVADLVRAIWGDILWLTTFDLSAFSYVYHLRGDLMVLGEVIRLPPWTAEELDDLIDLRCARAGIIPDFTKLVLTRQDDDTGQATAAERNRSDFIRFLWNASAGNPSVTLRLWAGSLVAPEDGRCRVRLPAQAATAKLDSLNTMELFVLRVIAQCELASLQDIAQGLRIPETQARAAVNAMSQHGLIEELDGLYRISWPWWRMVTHELERKNLLPRRLRGD